MDLVITILGWIALGVISAYLLAIIGKIIFDAATADYKLYKHVRLCRKRLLRQRYEDYAWLLFQLEKDTEVFNLTHNTRDWTFEDWREFYLKKLRRISNDYNNTNVATICRRRHCSNRIIILFVCWNNFSVGFL